MGVNYFYFAFIGKHFVTLFWKVLYKYIIIIFLRLFFLNRKHTFNIVIFTGNEKQYSWQQVENFQLSGWRSPSSQLPPYLGFCSEMQEVLFNFNFTDQQLLVRWGDFKANDKNK